MPMAMNFPEELPALAVLAARRIGSDNISTEVN
jgi:hypothetical protein